MSSRHSDPDSLERDDVRVLGGGAGVMVVGRLLGRGLQFLVQVVVARALGPVAFGLYALGWTVLRVLETFAMMGLQNGVVHFAGSDWAESPHRARRTIRLGLVLGATAGTLLGSLLFLSADFLALQVFHMEPLGPVIRIFAIAVPFVAATRIAAAATRIAHRMSYSVLAEDFAQPFLHLALLAALLPLGFGLHGAATSATVSFAASALLALAFLGAVLGPPRDSSGAVGGTSVARLLSYSASTGLAAALGYYIIWIDRIFLGLFRTAEEVGVYQAASQLATPMLVILAGFTSVVGPMVARLGRPPEPKRLNQLFRVSTKWGLYLCLPVFLLTLFGSPALIGSIFGPDYQDASLPLVILAAGQLVNVATGPVGMILIMSGYHGRWLAITVASVVANIALNAMLVPAYGAVGAAVATSVVLAGMLVAALLQARRLLGLWPYDRRYLKGLAATAATCLVLVALGALLKDEGLSALERLIALIVAIGLSYPTVLLALGLDAEDRVLLEQLRILRR